MRTYCPRSRKTRTTRAARIYCLLRRARERALVELLRAPSRVIVGCTRRF